MMAQIIDRKAEKRRSAEILSSAEVNPKYLTALFLGLILLLDLADLAAANLGGGLLATFASILSNLMSMVLTAGFVTYFMLVRRGIHAEYTTLFDGFSFVGKVIGLNIVMYFFVTLWSMLFFFPGIWAMYRYRFALLNLYENPSIGILDALNMSKVQTTGYKGQLFLLDLSYFGWVLLAALPTFSIAVPEAVATAEGLISGTAQIYAPAALTPFLLSSLWGLLVQLFYLPKYQCTEIAYFEIAKSTSGVGSESRPM